ncbi:MAG: hypothetical protein ACE5MM_04135 [Nitrospiraceae bacterium]
MRDSFRPTLFLFTGLLWLLVAFVLGLALWLSTILGHPLPQAFRLLHVHGALVGGVAQIILGAMLAFVPPLLMTGRDRPDSHPVLFGMINAGTIGMLFGFALGHSMVVGAAGLLVVAAFLSLLRGALRQARTSLVSPPLNLWFYGIALLALLGGLGVGEAMTAKLFTHQSIGQARLAHIHLNLLGFVTLTIVGTMHNLFPTVLNARLHSPRLAQLTFFVMPSGIAVLLIGFMLGNLAVDIVAGIILMIGVFLYGYNIVRTWLNAGQPRSAPSDHFLLATFFLALAVITGLLVTINSQWTPPPVPFGSLHLMAYTHLAMIGFIFQTILGALSHLLPITLAVSRVPSNKKRGPYLAELTRIVEYWRPIQVGSLNLGTIGLALVAALVWQLNLGSLPVKIGAWLCSGLLFLGFGTFAAKVCLLYARRPTA